MHAMEGQIEPKWWDMWPQDDRVAFLRDMAALQTRYEEVRLLHPGVDRMPDAAAEATSPTLFRMRRSMVHVVYLARNITLQLAQRDKATSFGSPFAWFREGVVGKVTAPEFNAEPLRTRTEVVHEFESCLDRVRRGEVNQAPDLEDESSFPALIALLERLRARRETQEQEAIVTAQSRLRRSSTACTVKEESVAVARALYKLPWWPQRPDKSDLRDPIKLALTELRKRRRSPTEREELVHRAPPSLPPRRHPDPSLTLPSQAAIIAAVNGVRSQIQAEESPSSLSVHAEPHRPSHTVTECRLQSLGHGHGEVARGGLTARQRAVYGRAGTRM
ncbi:hypothetical protein DMC30DRAFT_392533 [Rhodotorula diobovata]|uniref:Uncharacterized protein n=1 Tax=Rhodotorula diobovata TaxID=5288 RepID=A0A5C5G076_9BASI|nr:hypothetical protein DMC30DRAFT_392533 [Rhodotorula diobovata]